MKTTVLKICIVFLLITIFPASGCLKTPDTIVVENKSDDELMAAINHTGDAAETPSLVPAPTQSAEAIEIFEVASSKSVGHSDFSLSLEDKKIYLYADADITMPDVDAFPVYSYVRKDINMDFVSNAAAILAGDKPLYEPIYGANGLTKTHIENFIVAIHYDYKELDSIGALFRGIQSEEDLKETRDEELQYYYSLLDNAPTELNLSEQQKTLEDGYLIGWTNINNDYMAELRITSTQRGLAVEDVSSIGISYSMIGYDGSVLSRRLDYIRPGGGSIAPTTAAGGPFIYPIESQPETIEMTPQEAMKLAQDTFSRMGAGDDVKVSNIYYVEIPRYKGFDDLFCYGIELKRCIDNMPIQFNESSAIGAQKDNNDFSNQFTRELPIEEMTVFINDLGIIDLLWKEPIERADVLNENVELVDIDEIIEAFKKQFLLSYSYAVAVDPDSPQGKLEYNLYSIDLNYALARIPNQNDVFMAIPLWEFFSTVPIVYFDRDMNPFINVQYENLLTINAIDKSRFVHQWGY